MQIGSAWFWNINNELDNMVIDAASFWSKRGKYKGMYKGIQVRFLSFLEIGEDVFSTQLCVFLQNEILAYDVESIVIYKSYIKLHKIIRVPFPERGKGWLLNFCVQICYMFSERFTCVSSLSN